MQGVAILGSTGSIGTSALSVLRRHRDRFEVVALTAGANAALLAEQLAEWKPAFAALASDTGPGCLLEAATHPRAAIVVNAVVGFAGLEATLAALRAGKRVALANKESLVVAGELVRRGGPGGGGQGGGAGQEGRAGGGGGAGRAGRRGGRRRAGADRLGAQRRPAVRDGA